MNTAYVLGEETIRMPAKESPAVGRPPKVARKIKRLERRVRSVERIEVRQTRRLNRTCARRTALNGRLAALRATLEPVERGAWTAGGPDAPAPGATTAEA